MSDRNTRPEGGTNARPRGESIAGTAPGIPDEARGPSQELPEPPDEEEVEAAKRQLEKKQS